MSKKPTYEELEQRVRILEQHELMLKQADEDLGESGSWYSSILETINEAVILLSASGGFLTWNKKAEDIFGPAVMKSSGLMPAGKSLPVIHEDGSECAGSDYPPIKTLQTGRPCKNQVIGVYRSHDDLLWISVNTSPLFRKNEEKPYAVAVSFTDITESKMERDALQNLLDIAGVMILALNKAGEVTLINRKGCEILGGTEKDFLGKNWFELFAPKKEVEEAKNYHQDIMNSRIKVEDYSEYKIITLSGVEKNIAWHNSVIKDKDGLITGTLSSGEDITERKYAEEALHDREELLNRSQEIASLGSFVWDLKDDSLTWSRNMYAIHGLNEDTFDGNIIEASIQQIHPEDRDWMEKEIDKMLDANSAWDLEFRLVRQDGAERIIRSSGKQEFDAEGAPAKFFGIYQDITERKQAEERLRKSEEKLLRSRKMESLGLLAGGVAHDLNNVLSGIVSYPELLLMDLPEDSRLRKPIQTIHDSGTRAVAIVNDLLTIARGVASPKEPLSLNDIIGEYESSPEFRKLRQYHPEVEVRTDLKKDLLNINGSPIHIRKVIMNLVSNASEAIEGRGNVIISTMNRYVDRPVRGYEEVKTGEYAVFSVSDDGSGILPENIERIFEPFFTKKVMGKSGTGLGLTVVWNIVQDHEGYIDVSSNEGGTTFEIYFPVIRDEMPADDLPVSIIEYKGNGEKILVIDDEESQREITCKMLNTMGYSTEAVSSGEEAVAYLRERKADIIILDMIMTPGISGRETYKRIIRFNPKQKAIIVSGFAETDEIKETQRLGAGAYIKKPLMLQKLGMAVKEELSRPAG